MGHNRLICRAGSKHLDPHGTTPEAPMLHPLLFPKALTAYSRITEGWRARGCRTLIAQPTLRLSPSQPGHAVRACR